MKNNLAQGVRELRKRSGLSQETLATKSGLSLRTIQRVEKGETTPAGETLTRICSVLNTTPNELIDWGIDKEPLKNTIQAKHEYLHIFDNKLVITKTPTIDNLVNDYEKSVNNIFKTLAVFLIGVPLFAVIAVMFYYAGNSEWAFYAGAFSFVYLVSAFTNMLFISGTSMIKIENIYKISISDALFNKGIIIMHKESGRLKKRALTLEKSQVEKAKEILLSEKLITKKDISKTFNYILIFSIIVLPVIVYLLSSTMNIDNNYINGTFIILLTISFTIYGFIRSYRILHKGTPISR